MFTFRKNGHFYEKVGKKREPVCIDDEIPFDIPNSWEWCRFGYIVNYSLGKTPPRKEPIFWDDATVPWVSISDMVDGKIINSTKENVNNYALENSFKGILVPKGTLLMSFKLTVGKVSILGLDAVHNEAIISIKPFIDENNSFRDYLFRILPLISQSGDTKSAIKGKTLNSKSLNKLLIPLPPLNEQKRIINKIEDILPLIEEYGFNEEQLSKLNSEFPDKLRSSILQDAVQGKLVPQDSNDEPASILLEKIREEKERLIKEKKIKRNKKESFIYKKNNHYSEKVGKKGEPICIDDEIPFDIPESWQWCKLENIVTILGDGIHGTPNYDVDGEYYFINGNNLNNGQIVFKENTKKVNYDEYIKYKKDLNESTVLVSINGTIGNVAFYNGEKVMLGKSACYFNLFDNIFKKYIKLLIETDYFMRYALNSATGTTIKNVSLKSMKNWLIPIPPFNEQKEIVKRIENIINIIYS